MSHVTPEPAVVDARRDMAARIGALDWARAPLGPRSAWPIALRTLVEVMLEARQPMFVVWGPDRTMLYNDGYAVILGDKHPAALGRGVFDVWSEIRADLLPIINQAYAGMAVHMDEIALLIDRGGAPETAYFAFSYLPARDEATGVVGGFLGVCNEITTQRRLRESESEVRGVLEGMGEGFVLLDRDFHIQRINDEALRIDGRARADILGRHILRVWPETRGLPTWPMYQRLMAERVAGQVVYRHLSDAHDVWLDVRAYPSQNGLAVFYRDVSDTKNAEDALRASEIRFRALAQAMPNHAWTATSDGSLDWFNQQVSAYSGLASADLMGAGWLCLVHPDDAAGSAAAWTRCLRLGAPYETEFRIRRADGSYRWHLARALPIRAQDGDISHWVGTNTDIDDQKAATAALAALTSELEDRVAQRTAERDRVWRKSRDLLVVLGLDGVYRAVNPAWQAILGHPPEQVVGRNFRDFVWPEDIDAAQASLNGAEEKREILNFESRCRHADGSPRWISWNRSTEGDEVYAYGRDITAEKTQRAALDQAEEALRQSQKMEAVGQLTGGLAHDFNNLLTGIIGGLEMVQTRVAQGRVRDLDRYINAAQAAATRAASLTHRMLAFSRQQTLEPKPTDVNRLIGGMEELIRRTMGPQVTVEVVTAIGLWSSLVDPHQLENALLNLCINARDAMPEGGRLTIETGNRWLDDRTARERDVPPGQYLSVCVSDSGTGMTPEVIRRAFDPFFTTKPIGRGTGLGLSMIYGFVRQSGGLARIYSEVGQGAMVCMYLPRHLGEAVEEVDTRSELIAPRAALGDTVLVLDDEPAIRMLVTEMLQDHGCVTLEAADGPAGLKVLRSDARIDLLVTDVGLPGGMNGRQVAEAGREARPGLKVLFITGYAENAALSHGHLAPGMQILTKPFTAEALTSRVQTLLHPEAAIS